MELRSTGAEESKEKEVDMIIKISYIKKRDSEDRLRRLAVLILSKSKNKLDNNDKQR